MTQPLVPWAPPAARARIDEVAAELGDDLSVAHVAKVARAAIDGHERRLGAEGINLYAGTNSPSPLVRSLFDAGVASRPSMGWPGAKAQTGLDDIDVLEVLAARTVGAVMGAVHAEIRIQSATFANLAVFTALAEPGDTIAVLPEAAGGHNSHHATGSPGIRGLRVVDLPYDVAARDVDLAALPAFLAEHRPTVVVIGASLMLFPHRVEAVREAVDRAGAVLVFDASHIAGLVAGRRFQRPLKQGAHVMTFSTYKSFGGPPGGAIVTDDAALAERISDAVYPGMTANYDPGRLAPLAAAAAEAIEDDGAYPDACIAAARSFAADLAAAGLDVVAADRGFTESHHVAVDASAFGGGAAAAVRLAEAGIYLSAIALPDQDPAAPEAALRIGTQEVTRRGVGTAGLRQVARWCADVLLHGADPATVKAKVRELRGA
ncbi:MAG: glycine hydroxymethyltransferase [Streptosporangiales bacterium]|nr:glycine hydroxymethyltransferase [Streptosporangiales bacterium]